MTIPSFVLNTVQLKLMDPSENQEQKCEAFLTHLQEPVFAFFDELESIGPQKPLAVEQKEPEHLLEGYCQPEVSHKLFPLREVQEGQQYQAEPSLFHKLSAEVSPSDVSPASSSQKIKRRLQNDTKNIPKNFGKGILNFIQNNESVVLAFLGGRKDWYGELMRYVRSKKGSISTIAKLRELWTDGRMGRCMRVLSNLFLRKYSLRYIFNSRIVSYGAHVKYRSALWEALHRPEEFNHIKKY